MRSKYSYDELYAMSPYAKMSARKKLSYFDLYSEEFYKLYPDGVVTLVKDEKGSDVVVYQYSMFATQVGENKFHTTTYVAKLDRWLTKRHCNWLSHPFTEVEIRNMRPADLT